MTKTVNINGIEYNTYACLCEADVYNNAILGSKWNTLEETDQAKLLIQATRLIDSYKYVGEKQNPEQPLKFPRVTAGGKVSDDKVLTELCCQLAAYYLSNGTSSSGGDSSNILSQLDNYQIGDLKIGFKSDAQLDLSGLDDYILKALDDWMVSSSMQIWL